MRRGLRRYSMNDARPCTNPHSGSQAWCDATTPLDEIDYPIDSIVECFDWPKDDSRWPVVCARCQQPFTEKDHRDVARHMLYRRSGTEELLTLHEAKPGDMWNAWWLQQRFRGPDGLALIVKLPGNGDWVIDGPSQQHPAPNAWTRTGTPPLITVSPSILTDHYHGWLRDGILSDV